MFPFIENEVTEELRTSINEQNNTVQALLVLDDWINKNWVKPSKSANSTVNEIYGRLVDKDYAWSLAMAFLNHRRAVKQYLTYLKGATRVFNYLNETQIQWMNDRFWWSDEMCSNNFTCTQDAFFTNIDKDLGTGRQNVTSDLESLADVAYDFPDVERMLLWKFEVNGDY